MSDIVIKVTERIFRNGVLVATPGDYIDEERAAMFGILADGTKDQSIEDAPDVYALTRPEALAEPTAAEKKAITKAIADADRKAAEAQAAEAAQAEAEAEAARVAETEAAAAAAEAARTAAGGTGETAAQTPGETA